MAQSRVAHAGVPPVTLDRAELRGGHVAQGYVSRVAGGIVTVQMSRNVVARMHVRRLDPRHLGDDGEPTLKLGDYVHGWLLPSSKRLFMT